MHTQGSNRRRCQSLNIFKQTKGSVALYVLLLLPVLLTLTSVAIDVSGWNALRDELQKEADRIALQAASALPDRNAAQEFAAQAIQQLPQAGIAGELTFPGDKPAALRVTLRVAYKSSFDSLVRAAVGDSKSKFRIERSAVVQAVPTDTVLVMADGNSLRPRLQFGATPQQTRLDPAWGNALDWPASTYFRCTSAPKIADVGVLWDWWNSWNAPDFQRWATQACFNPVLTPFKFSVLSFVDSVQASLADRLAVVFTPGDLSGRGFFPARHIHSEGEDASLYAGQIGGFPEAQLSAASAHWSGYQDLPRFIGDETCMLMSHPQATVGSAYELAESPFIGSGAPESCSDPLEVFPCGNEHSAEGHFRDCFLAQGLSIRQAIYWHAARLNVPGFDATPNIPAALQQAWTELIPPGAPVASAFEQSKRGNLAFSALRRIVVFTDFLPEPSAGSPNINEFISAFGAQHIQLTFVVFSHEGLTPLERETLTARTKLLKEMAASNSHLRIHDTDSAAELQNVIGPLLNSLGRQFAIQR